MAESPPLRIREFEERYLGDGVYVSFDGSQFWLKTLGARYEQEIALEPEVVDRLTDYIATAQAKVREMRSL